MAAYIDALAQDCSISSALAMEILQSCTKPSIWAKASALSSLSIYTNCSDNNGQDFFYALYIYEYHKFRGWVITVCEWSAFKQQAGSRLC